MLYFTVEEEEIGVLWEFSLFFRAVQSYFNNKTTSNNKQPVYLSSLYKWFVVCMCLYGRSLVSRWEDTIYYCVNKSPSSEDEILLAS